jgi:hypothetical protein
MILRKVGWGDFGGDFFANSSGVDVMITIFGNFRRKNWRFSPKPML